MTKDRLCAAAAAPILNFVNKQKMEMAMLKTAFWQCAAQSFPTSVRRRYSTRLERAERVDLFIAAIVDALRRALAPRDARLHPQP